jgi:hypothetical protein
MVAVRRLLPRVTRGDTLGGNIWHCVLGRRIVVIVNRDPIPVELLNLLPRSTTQKIADVGDNVPARCTQLIDDRSIDCRHDWSTRLTLEWDKRGRSNLEVFLRDVEEGAMVDIPNADKVAHLVLVLDPPNALANHQHTFETALVVLWPFVLNFLARVEESSHGRADGSNAAGEGSLRHGGFMPLPISWYGTYVFLP